jgi:glycosyltransferase involved in cell wall biosynthesis
MLSAGYLDVRAGRCAQALSEHGIVSEAVSWRVPPQFRHAYESIIADPLMDWRDLVAHVKKSKADVIHVHCELQGYWAALAAKEGAGDRPVICDIHDLNCARTQAMFDPHELSGFNAGDAYVWVTQEQRDYAERFGLTAQGKPEVFLTNYASSSVFIDKTRLPHIGGLVYAGGIARRGEVDSERDLSLIADLVPLHVYSGGDDPDYGICHKQEVRYPLYIQRLAQHSWGLVGTPTPQTSWLQSMPTKLTEYFAAGIPIVAMNVPLAREFCEMGMGVYLDDIRDLPRVLTLDPKPYRKAVMAQRRQFCIERIIEPLVEMYRGLV